MSRMVKRKWGHYWTILDRKNFKVKLLRFKKYHKCSMQYHNLRSELWLFLSGYGTMNGLGVGPGQYYLVEKRKLHQYYARRVSYVLEIQYGELCEESDIVRL